MPGAHEHGWGAPLIPTPDFIRLFHGGDPWVLWLGAAVSVRAPSGIPLAGAIRNAIWEALTRPPAPEPDGTLLARARRTFETAQALAASRPGVAAGASRTMSFEAFLEQVQLHSLDLVAALLQRLFPDAARAAPNQDHIAALRLFRDGPCDLLFTTNFDECFEAAAKTEMPELVVEVPVDTGFDVVRGRTLLKLHGTIARSASLAASTRGLDARARSAAWKDSLFSAIAGRNVLVVGYSFSDPFDITPVLRRAVQAGTRFYWARPIDEREGQRPRHGWRGSPLPLAGTVANDCSDPRTDILLLLAGLPRSEVGRWVPEDEQAGVAGSAVAAAVGGIGLSLAVRLEIAAALLYWIEEGGLATDLFLRARDHGAPIDEHSVARAYARARRYSAALLAFNRILRDGLPSDAIERAKKTIDVCMGAGWCARAGGRPGLGQRYYSRAEACLAEAGLVPETLGPYLADQYFRSLAGQHIRFAEMAWARGAREGHLVRAETLLAHLEAVGEIEPKSRPLRDLALAQIALVRRERDQAVRLLERVKAEMELWGDPHDLAVCHRTLANSDPRRYGHLLREEAIIAWRRGRWLEWQKISVERLGFGRPGRLDPLRWRLRNSYIALWDAAKELRRAALCGNSQAPVVPKLGKKH